jgi:hypothetical protein
VFKAQWSKNQNAPSHFTVGNMRRGIDVIGGDGEHIVSLYDPEITAIPAGAFAAFVRCWSDF